jgi:hypothetical protein
MHHSSLTFSSASCSSQEDSSGVTDHSSEEYEIFMFHTLENYTRKCPFMLLLFIQVSGFQSAVGKSVSVQADMQGEAATVFFFHCGDCYACIWLLFMIAL